MDNDILDELNDNSGTGIDEATLGELNQLTAGDSVDLGNTDASNAPQSRTPSQMVGDTMDWAGDTAAGFTTGLTQGASLETGDEFEGWAETLTSPSTLSSDDSVMSVYEKNRDRTRERYKQNYDNAPIATNVGKVIGMLTPWSLALRGAGAVKSAIVGGGTAAIEYMGGEEDWDDITAKDTAKWGVIGAIPVEAVTGGIKAFRGVFGAKSKDQVADMIQALVNDSGLTPNEIMKEAAKYGDIGSLVDATGGAGIAHGQGLVGTSGANVMDKFKSHLSKIYEGKNRIKKAMTAVTGKERGSYFGSLESLKTGMRERAKKNYGESIKEARFDITPEMSRLMQRNKTVREAWENVQQRYADNGIDLPDWYKIGEDGVPTVPDVGFSIPGEVMQHFKFAMDKAEKTIRGSTDSVGKTLHSAIANDKREMMDVIYKQSPSFKAANRAYAGDIAIQDAQELGYKNGLGGPKVEEQLQAIKKMTPSERDAYLQGVMTNVYGKLGTSDELALGAVTSMVSDNGREVLDALIGKEKAGKLASVIRNEKKFRGVKQDLVGGSQTTPRLTSVENYKKLENTNQKGIVDTLTDAASNVPIIKNSAARFGREIFGIQELTPAMRMELTDLMLQPGGTGVALERLKMAGATQDEASHLLAVLRMGSSTPSQIMSMPEPEDK